MPRRIDREGAQWTFYTNKQCINTQLSQMEPPLPFIYVLNTVFAAILSSDHMSSSSCMQYVCVVIVSAIRGKAKVERESRKIAG